MHSRTCVFFFKCGPALPSIWPDLERDHARPCPDEPTQTLLTCLVWWPVVPAAWFSLLKVGLRAGDFIDQDIDLCVMKSM